MSKKITELVAIDAIADADSLVLVDDSTGSTKRATALQVKDYAEPWTYYTKTSDTIAGGPTGTTLIDIPGLSAPLQANTKYEFIIRVIVSATSGTATGIQISLDGPAGTAQVYYFLRGRNTSGNTLTGRGYSSFGNDPGFTASPGTIKNLQEMNGFIITGGTAGNLQPLYASEGASGTINVFAQSYIKIREIPQS
jgi:hypothetical protein